MPSLAAQQFNRHIAAAEAMLGMLGKSRRQRLDRPAAVALAHAALASAVSAWESYLERVDNEFLLATARPAVQGYAAIHALLRDIAASKTAKFNTPNAENSREMLVLLTGYDPIGDWVWPRARLGAVQTRSRLNEILKVRHSFAHGFPLPAYPWTTTPTGAVSLSARSVRQSASFLRNLVVRTDRGLHRHLRHIHGVRVSW